RADRAAQGSRDPRRTADLQGRRSEAGRAPVEPRTGARRVARARHRRRPQDHAPGDGKPDRFDARDRVADAVSVQAQGPDSDGRPARDPGRYGRPARAGLRRATLPAAATTATAALAVFAP